MMIMLCLFTVVELQAKVSDYEQQIANLNQKVEEAQQSASAASNAQSEGAVGGAPPPLPPGPPPPPPPPPPTGKKCLWGNHVSTVCLREWLYLLASLLLMIIGGVSCSGYTLMIIF